MFDPPKHGKQDHGSEQGFPCDSADKPLPGKKSDVLKELMKKENPTQMRVERFNNG